MADNNVFENPKVTVEWDEKLQITGNDDIQTIAKQAVLNWVNDTDVPEDEQTLLEDVVLIGYVRHEANWRCILVSKTIDESIFEVAHNDLMGSTSLNVYDLIDSQSV